MGEGRREVGERRMENGGGRREKGGLRSEKGGGRRERETEAGNVGGRGVDKRCVHCEALVEHFRPNISLSNKTLYR